MIAAKRTLFLYRPAHIPVTGMGQAYMERLMGLDYVAVKTTYNLWVWILRAIFGVGFLVGVLIFAYDYFKLGREPMPAVSAVPEKG